MELQIFDTNGIELNVGDLVAIQQQRNNNLTFYSRVQIIDGQLYPFNKFCYDRIVKIDQVPEGCTHAQQKGNFPEYWINKKQELIMIDEGKLEKWILDSIVFDRSSFFRVK